MMEQLLTTIHILSLVLLSLFGAYRAYLLMEWLLLKRKRREEAVPPSHPSQEAPFVTVQLPLYNERYVAARLLNAVAGLRWPLDRLEIQVLDDSDDDTASVVDEVCERLKGEGFPIHVIRREGRQGYKAGALALGLTRARGEFVAVFDADFVPGPDFLLRTIPHFQDPRVGMVQARWGFLNEDYSLLTRIQAIFLRYHFMVEQRVRDSQGWFFNFNGTAGVWRRRAIEEAGGWQPDTVTEDLDLSLRAALLGWKFLYLDGVEVQSELPVTLSALRAQQSRWAKGSMQTLRKMFLPLWTSSWSFPQKFHATMLLLSNTGWLLGMAAFLSLMGVLGSPFFHHLDYLLLLFFACGSIFLSFGLLEYLTQGGRGGLRILAPLAVIPLAGIVLAPRITVALFSGLVKRGGEFCRTPKAGVVGKALTGSPFSYHSWEFFPVAADLLLLLYCLLTAHLGHAQGYPPTMLFFALISTGLLAILVVDLREALFLAHRAGR